MKKRNFLLIIIGTALCLSFLVGCGPRKLSYAHNASGAARSSQVLPNVHRIIARSRAGFESNYEQANGYFQNEANEVCGSKGFVELTTEYADRKYQDILPLSFVINVPLQANPEFTLNMAEKKGYIYCHNSQQSLTESANALAAQLEAERKEWLEGVE